MRAPRWPVPVGITPSRRYGAVGDDPVSAVACLLRHAITRSTAPPATTRTGKGSTCRRVSTARRQSSLRKSSTVPSEGFSHTGPQLMLPFPGST